MLRTAAIAAVVFSISYLQTHPLNLGGKIGEFAGLKTEETASADSTPSASVSSDESEFRIPDYTGEQAVIINDNTAYFTSEDLSLPDGTFNMSPLGDHGRAGASEAVISKADMPTEPRSGSLSGFTPSGWKQAYYPDMDLAHLMERCHLVGFQFKGTSSNDIRNLITGTHYFNVESMLTYENKTAEYIRSHPDDAVVYRVTPYFGDNELVARGVLMEAQSVKTENYKLCVWCWNVQPGIVIDYKTGESHKGDTVAEWTSPYGTN